MEQIGRYRLDAVEGVGAFATVWRGHDPELDVTVAVKVLADNWAHDGDVRERFLEEARLLRRIHDPRVVRVHDVGVHLDRPYFVMDFLPGGTVGQAVAADRTRAVQFAVECAQAVQSLHDAGVLHRDVKPSNLLLDAHGRVLVSDLGSAKQLAEASGITVVTGTPVFMAPEQAMGQPIDARSDVYSLGVVAYQLLTGRVPFDGPLGRTAGDRMPPTGAGPAIDRVLASATAVRPADRPASAAAFADSLAGAVSGEARPAGDVAVAHVVMIAAPAFAAATGLTWWLLR